MTFNTAQSLPTIITASDVEEAVIETLRPRLPYYMTQMGLQPPRSYHQTSEFAKWPEEMLPCIIVICPGLADPPRKRGDGTYAAPWLVGVACVSSANNEENTRKIARQTGALIRAVLLQQPSLTPKGFARGVTWNDESYDQVELADRRSLSSAEISFVVEVEGVVNARELPYLPGMDEIPTPSGIVADEAIVTVQNMGGS